MLSDMINSYQYISKRELDKELSSCQSHILANHDITQILNCVDDYIIGRPTIQSQ